jgi:hypothetical protein
VFIRVANNPEDGCRELQSRGALPFPEEDFWKGKVTDILNGTAPRPDQSQPVPASESGLSPPATLEQSSESEASVPASPEIASRSPVAAPAAPVVTGPDTCYERCLPLLLQNLREEADKKQLSEIAKRLEILPRQLDEWLKRAIGEGKVTKAKKKRRFVYTSASLGEGQTLFNRGGDAA